ncbi:MAG: radical SAM protein [Pseudomonadota bacterium]
MKDYELKWIAWEATRRCNLECIHCRSSSFDEASDSHFSKVDVFKLIDDISSFSNPTMVLTGGEPLLRKDIFEIASYGSSKGLNMAMATNGTLVSDEICEKIIKSGIKIASLSFDASSALIHDDFRKSEGAFESSIKAAELFKKHNIKFLINSSFTTRNQSEIENTYKLAKHLGAIAWYMFLIVPTGRGKEVLNELISKDDYEDILRWHYQIEKNEKEMIVRPTCAPQYYRIRKEEEAKDGAETQKKSLMFGPGGGKGCVCAQSICFVNYKGEVYPCSYFPLSAGSVFEKNIKDIWENAELFKSLRNFKDYKGNCGHCRYINICGGCRARAYAISGDYLEEEPYCDYGKAL